MEKWMLQLRATRIKVFVALFTLLWSTAGLAQHYTRTDLTQDVSSPDVPNTDPNLVNAWGLSRSSGSPWWVSDNGTGLSTLYNAAGAALPLVVTIPTPDGNGTSTPTGTVFNYTTDFQVAPDKPAVFLFVTEDGTISGWNPTAKATEAIIKVNRAGKSVYKGCALAQGKHGTFLYVADFMHRRIEIFDSKFNRVKMNDWAFRDPAVPRGYAPFNVQNVGGNLVVTFAKLEAGGDEEEHGAGLGFVSIFSRRGRLLQRLQHGPWFNAPWGVAEAPSDFGAFSHRLLIGNFGDGAIHAFNTLTGRMEGALLDVNGAPILVDGLWALSFGNNATAGSAVELYFTAGPGDEEHGLLGKIVPSADQRGNSE